MKITYPIILIIAVVGVALADVFLKQATVVEDGIAVAYNPWFWISIVLYLIQITTFAFLLEKGYLLSYVGILQTTLYGVIVLGSSFFVFGEHLTKTHGIGIALALAGTVLMSLP